MLENEPLICLWVLVDNSVGIYSMKLHVLRPWEGCSCIRRHTSCSELNIHADFDQGLVTVPPVCGFKFASPLCSA